jgi:hypothetical protein
MQSFRRSSPCYAQADIAFNRRQSRASSRSEIADVAVDARVLGQFSGNAAAALEGFPAVAPRRDGSGRKGDDVGAGRAPPDIAFEIGLPKCARAPDGSLQQSADAAAEHVGAVESDGGELIRSAVDRNALPDPLRLRLDHQPWRERDRIAAPAARSTDRRLRLAMEDDFASYVVCVVGSGDPEPFQHFLSPSDAAGYARKSVTFRGAKRAHVFGCVTTTTSVAFAALLAGDAEMVGSTVPGTLQAQIGADHKRAWDQARQGGADAIRTFLGISGSVASLFSGLGR